MLFVAGALALWAASESRRVLRQPDFLLLVNTRVLLALLGLFHVFLSGYILTASSRTIQAGVILWLGVNHLVYRAAKSWLGVAGTLPVVEVLARKCGVQTWVVNGVWKWVVVYWIASSLLVLLLEWRQRRRQEKELFMENWRKQREGLSK